MSVMNKKTYESPCITIVIGEPFAQMEISKVETNVEDGFTYEGEGDPSEDQRIGQWSNHLWDED